MHVSPVRLLVLGLLAREPMHGHEIKREVELRDLEAWAGIASGALYGTLRRLEQEGLVRPLRTEQVGRYPTRTVYEVTDQGRRELGLLAEAALESEEIRLGAFDIALLVATALPASEAGALIERRRRRLQLTLDQLHEERERKEALGQLGPVEVVLMRHIELQQEAELRWHEVLADALPGILGIPAPNHDHTEGEPA